LRQLAEAGRIGHLARVYRRGDLSGATLAFAATGDGAVNAAVAREGRRRRVWVNAADDPVHCDFILPSVLRRGRLTVAVSTGGASPAVARAVREELEAVLTPAHAALLEIAGAVRADARARGASPDGDRWRRALGRSVRRLIAEGRPVAARRELERRLETGRGPRRPPPPGNGELRRRASRFLGIGGLGSPAAHLARPRRRSNGGGLVGWESPGISDRRLEAAP
jgi:siroheme synthase-like protein